MAVDLGSIIWTAVRAIVKFVLTAMCGFVLARAKLLDSAGTRAISQAILNVFLPSLLFNKVVQGIDRSNMRQVGVLALTAILYTAIGLTTGFIVRFVTKVPRGWRNGVLAAGAFSNWGDLPLVVIGTIVSAPPFGGATDEAKGLAYVAVYMFVQSTIMFACNGIWLVSRDFNHPADSREPESMMVKVRHIGNELTDLRRRAVQHHSKTDRSSTSTEDGENVSQPSVHLDDSSNSLSRWESSKNNIRPGESLGVARHRSTDSLDLRPVTSGVVDHGDIHATIDPSAITRVPSTLPFTKSGHLSANESIGSSSSALNAENDGRGNTMSKRFSWPKVRSNAKAGLIRLLSPPSVATISGFVIAVVPVLKALFVPVPGVSMPSAPDGKPPLDFLLDTTSFIGNASVPSSLLILGYSLSKLNLSRLPALSSALVMACLKMVVTPIIAIAWMQFLASPTGLVDPGDLVLRLALVLPSAVPTATSLLYITQIFAPEGREENVQCLSVFLIVQYLFVGVTLTITVVYTLNLIT